LQQQVSGENYSSGSNGMWCLEGLDGFLFGRNNAVIPLQQAGHRAEFVCDQQIVVQTERNALISAKYTAACVRLIEISRNLIMHLLSADRTVSTMNCM
jgi:hypothetical protein